MLKFSGKLIHDFPATLPENMHLPHMTFRHAMTLEEIGEKFDLTRERVRQIKEKAVRRLKQTSRSKILKTYLG